ncbi:MAG: hypothetical protein FWE91_05635 [Defluviitaleaceae bacterium]|nr:hypothetical protein [Defluviitaleaceae bacterium]
MESYINAQLKIDDASVARAYVRLRPLNDGEKGSYPDNPYGYFHDVAVGNDNEQHFVASFNDTFIHSAQRHVTISADVISAIARGLMRHLFTAEQRNVSN